MNALLCCFTLLVAGDTGEQTKSGPAHGEKGEAYVVPADTVEQVRAFLPPGWSLNVQADALVVRREAQIRIQRILPGMPLREPGQPDETTYLEHYEITLHCQTRLTPELHAAKAAAIHHQLERLNVSMMAFRIPKPTKSWPPYLPTTAQEREELKEFNRLLKTRQDLPEYFDQRVSIDVRDSLAVYGHIVDDAERADCARMREILQGLFQRYDQGPATADLHRLRGEWVVLSLVSSGKPLGAARGTRCVFSWHDWRPVPNAKPDPDDESSLWTIARTFELAAQTPFGFFDETHTQQHKVWRPSNPGGSGVLDRELENITCYRKGIYRFVGERLMICLGDENLRKSEAVRPTEFASRAGDRRSLIKLQRPAVSNDGRNKDAAEEPTK